MNQSVLHQPAGMGGFNAGVVGWGRHGLAEDVHLRRAGGEDGGWIGPDRGAVGRGLQAEPVAAQKHPGHVGQVGLTADKGAQDAAGRAGPEAAVAETDAIEVDGIPRGFGGIEQAFDVMGRRHVNELIQVQNERPGMGAAGLIQATERHMDALPAPGVVDEGDERIRPHGKGKHGLPQSGGVVVIAGEVDVVEADRAMIGEPFRSVGRLPTSGSHQSDTA